MELLMVWWYISMTRSVMHKFGFLSPRSRLQWEFQYSKQNYLFTQTCQLLKQLHLYPRSDVVFWHSVQGGGGSGSTERQTLFLFCFVSCWMGVVIVLYHECLCEYCANVDLKLQSVNAAIQQDLRIEDRYHASRITLCAKELGEYRRKPGQGTSQLWDTGAVSSPGSCSDNWPVQPCWMV